ncbi:tyrosine recombinase XerC [Nocardioides marmotae]|uniref:site-specific integrase n=1 Tax=Nocardioides marmotae TaxID=2663857 RepID=UPI0012B506E4|nr:site-specific integrase [Nocardioides marmotae]MBC9734493.1 site-specific integrase [Nocardioides marmotae]MTB85593.1 tyrosine-type recombinase/integrase [Nocardioides marmotae]
MATKKGAVPKSQGIRYRLRKDGTVRGYEVRYRDPEDSSKVRGKTFRTLDEAKAFQRDNLHSIQHGTYIAPEKGETTWATVRDEWLTGHSVRIKPRTLNGYRCILGIERKRLNTDRVIKKARQSHFAGWDNRPIGSITRADVRQLVGRVRTAGLREETEHRIFNVANAILTYAEQEGYIRTNPATAVRKELRSVKKKEFKARALTVAEAEHIISHLPEGRYRLFTLLGFWTGLRAGELAGLQVRNVDHKRCRIRVEATIQDLNGVLSAGTTKSEAGYGRKVPMPPSVMDQITAHIDANGLGPDDYVFAGPNEYFHYQNFRNRQWLPALKAAGFWGDGKPTVRFHDLRHTRLTLWAPQVPPHVLKAWAGHANITTTFNVYVHADDNDPQIEALVERLYGAGADNVVPLTPRAHAG